MRGRNELKVERSISVSARVDVVKLVDLAVWFTDAGLDVTTISKLVGFAVDMAWTAIDRSDGFKARCKSVEEADRVLQYMGLRQMKMHISKNQRKLTMAKAFESLRAEGDDPESYAPIEYKKMHNAHSVTDEDISLMRHVVGRFGSGRFDKYFDPITGKYKGDPADSKSEEKVVDKQETMEEREARLEDYLKKARTEKYEIKDKSPIAREAKDTSEMVKKLNAEREAKEKEVRDNAAAKLKIELDNAPKVGRPKKVVNEDMIRSKTDKEINADYERIAEKDKLLNEQLDAMCGLGKENKIVK